MRGALSNKVNIYIYIYFDEEIYCTFAQVCLSAAAIAAAPLRSLAAATAAALAPQLSLPPAFRPPLQLAMAMAAPAKFQLIETGGDAPLAKALKLYEVDAALIDFITREPVDEVVGVTGSSTVEAVEAVAEVKGLGMRKLEDLANVAEPDVPGDVSQALKAIRDSQNLRQHPAVFKAQDLLPRRPQAVGFGRGSGDEGRRH